MFSTPVYASNANTRSPYLNATPTLPLQFFEVKEINQRAAATREAVRALVRRTRGPVTLESLFLRRELADLWAEYRTHQADSHHLTAAYIAQTKSQKPHALRLASSHTQKPTQAAA